MGTWIRALWILCRVVSCVGLGVEMFGSPADGSVMFATMIVNNFYQCSRLCVVTGGCQARKYDAEFRECHLYMAPEHITTRVPDGDNLSQEDKEDKVSPSPCRGRPCRKDQICVVAASGDGHVCLSGSDCGRPPLRPTLVMAERGWNESYLGALSVYTCELGHNRTGGSGVTVCQDSGQWSPPTLQCTAVDCGIPAARNNTEPSVQMTTTFNTTVTFTCSAGYRNHGGDDTITCQANGQWSSTSLDCQAVDCGIPAARNNTEPSVQMTTTFNTTVTFTCSAGYRNHGGDDTITCQANGQWSSTSLDCQAVDCGIPAARNYTEPSVQMTTTFNTTVTFTCSAGYRNHGGDDSITCQANGQWSSTSLDCQAVDCGIPAARNNTEPSVQMTTTFNTTVTFTCSAGYRNHGGDDTITCQANGQWSSTSLDCQAVDCGIPAARNYTEPSVQMTTTFNTTVTFTCSAGYRNHGGDDSITCQANGQWSSTSLDCQAVDCGIPAARNNTEPSVQMTTTFNTTVTFTCSAGYRNHGGDDTITCQANGQWSSTSLDCQAVDCGIPAARNNTEPSVQMTTTFNTTVTFTCSAGYRNHGGDDTITCQANGQWSSTSLDCQAVDCGIPAARNNTEPSVQMTTTFNTTVTFTCSAGYRNHGGDDTITCQANGQWSSTSLDCQAVDCGIPAARNYTEPSVQMTTTFNTTVTFTCSAGYRNHGGDDTITCQANGQWSSTSLDCQAVDCGIPAARNNTEPSVQMTTTFNTTVTFTCSAGYRNHGGDDTITCQANGQWSSTSLDCQAVDCGIPAARNNTEPSVQMTTTFNTTVTFTCSVGYRNHGGDDTITCQANGQWSSTSFDCRVIRNWITTKTLSAGPAKLTCTDRISPAGSLVSVSCEADEMLIDCSSKSASSSGKNNGVKIVMVKDTPFCQIDITSTTGASAQYASARCCKQDGLQCEYLTDGPSKNINDAHVQSECFKFFQVMGCGVHQPNGYLDGVKINPSYCRAYAGDFSVTGVYSYATCCRAQDLSCTVHSAKPQPVKGLLKATCPDGFTLTGCGGYNPWREARGSYVADDAGTPTCHVESTTDRPDRTIVFYVCC